MEPASKFTFVNLVHIWHLHILNFTHTISVWKASLLLVICVDSWYFRSCAVAMLLFWTGQRVKACQLCQDISHMTEFLPCCYHHYNATYIREGNTRADSTLLTDSGLPCLCVIINTLIDLCMSAVHLGTFVLRVTSHTPSHSVTKMENQKGK